MNIQPSWPTKECGFIMKRVCNMMRTYSQSVKGVRFVDIVEKTYVYSSLKRVRNKHLFQLYNSTNLSFAVYVFINNSNR